MASFDLVENKERADILCGAKTGGEPKKRGAQGCAEPEEAYSSKIRFFSKRRIAVSGVLARRFFCESVPVGMRLLGEGIGTLLRPTVLRG